MNLMMTEKTGTKFLPASPVMGAHWAGDGDLFIIQEEHL